MIYPYTIDDMPEAPEVEYIRQELFMRLPSQKVLDYAVPYAKDQHYNLVGKEIADVTRKGKYLSIDFTDQTALIVHLAMTGRLSWKDPIKHIRFIMSLTSGSLFFSDTRKFGKVKYLSAIQKDMLFNSLGLDILL